MVIAEKKPVLAEKQFKVKRSDHNYSIACQKQSLNLIIT